VTVDNTAVHIAGTPVAAAAEKVFRERNWVALSKLMVDIAALEISLYSGYLLFHLLARWVHLPLPLHRYQEFAVGMLLVPVGYWLMGLYPGYGLTAVERLQRRVRVTFVIFAVLLLWDFLMVSDRSSLAVLTATLLVSLLLTPLLQAVLRKILIYLDCWGTPVLVITAGRFADGVVAALDRDRILGFRPIGILTDNHLESGRSIAGIPVLGPIASAGEFACTIRYAIIALPKLDTSRIVALSAMLPFPHVVIIPDLCGLQSLWVKARDLGGILGLELKKDLLQERNAHFKRCIDYLLGVPLLLASLPLMVLLALWIKLVSPGPALFNQEREGYDGSMFRLWKLRTMYQDADCILERHLAADPVAHDEWFRFFKLRNDPRVLPWIGTILRKTSLDELPQLWNVLCGEMSLVGPRPFPKYHLDNFPQEFRELRRSVLPGLTGLWQVSARSDGDLQVQEQLDTYYIRNWSIWLDLTLLGKTIWIVLTGKGAY
jgi:Undecaprenyl-phosphate galactose phosphotransferase WbaP